MKKSSPFYRGHLNLMLTSAGNLVGRSPFRSFIIVLSLAAILFPFLAAISISEGIKEQSKISVEEGADFYVAGDAAGSSVPLPLNDIDRFKGLPGVSRVVPRIVGRAYLGEGIVTVVGMPEGTFPESLQLISGRGVEKKNEVIVGAALSHTYDLKVGSRFYLPVNRWKKFTVVGVFSSKSTIWSAKLLYMSLEDAGDVFRMKGTATDFLIYAKPGDTQSVNVHLQLENKDGNPFRAQSRELVQSYFQKGFDSRAGVFTAFSMAAFALAVPLVLIVAGLGGGERRKEIATLKAVGWQTLDVIKMVMWENILLSLAAAGVALLLTFLWIKGFNGFFIAQFFIAEPGLAPDFPVPSRFVPLPAFLAFLLSLTLTMTGSLYYTWKVAMTPPADILR
jgi:ABC-type lipoprotein release transport system permease subunit